MSLEPFIAIAAALMGIGVYGIVVYRNSVRILISVEVMFNAALLLLLAYASIRAPLEGSLLALFTIALASAEVGVVIPILVLMFRIYGTTDVVKASEMKG